MKKIKILGFLTSVALPVSALISCGEEKETANTETTGVETNPSSDATDDDQAQEGDGVEVNSNLTSIISDQIFEQFKKTNKNSLPDSVQKPDDFILDIPQDDSQNQSVNIKIKEWTANNEQGEIKWKVEIQKDQSSKEVYGHLTGYLTQNQHDMQVALDEFNAEQIINNKIKTQHIDLEKLPSQQIRPDGIEFTEVTSQGMQALIKDWQVIDSEGKIIYTVVINIDKFSKEFILEFDGMKTTAQEQAIEDAAKSITTSGIQGLIQVDQNNIPSDVVDDFTNLSLASNPHQLELVVDYETNDQNGFVTWKIDINEKTIDSTIGRTIHSIYGVTSGFLSSIEKELQLVDISKVLNIPTADAQILPSAVEAPVELQYPNYDQISATITNWNANDSLGTIDYEIEFKKQQYTRTVSGQITGYKNNQSDQNDQILIDYASINNHKIMELINNNFLLKPSEISQPSDFSQEITTDQGVSGAVNVQILEWNQHDDHGDIHYKLNISKGNINKNTYGHVTGFLTTEQKELKDKFDQIQISDIQNMPTLESGILASKQEPPLADYLEINNINQNDFEIIIQKWDANDALGTIDYEIKVSHNGLFEKIVSGQITGIITSDEVVSILSELQSITFNDIIGIPESDPSTLASDVTEPNISLARLADKYDIEILEFDNGDLSDKGIIDVSIMITHKLYDQYEKNIQIIIPMFMTFSEYQIKQKIDAISLDDLEILNSISSDFDTFTDQSILPGSVAIPEIQTVEVGDRDLIDVTWKLWNPIYSQGIIKVEVEVKQERFTKVLTKDLGPFKTEQDVNDQILIDSIIPETFINFPTADSSVFPTTIAQPTIGQLIDGVDITMTKWEQNDFSGKINWEIKITKGNVDNNVSGTIEGYNFKAWSWTEQAESGNVPTEIPNYVRHIQNSTYLTFTEDLVIPDSVTYVGHYGFQNIVFEGDATLIVGSGWEVIGFTVFWAATFNNGLDLSNTNIRKLSSYAFKYADFSGSALKMPDSLEEISGDAFGHANIQSDFTLKNITTEDFWISDYAFQYAQLPSGFELPDVSSLYIGESAFKSTTFKDGFTIPLTADADQVVLAFDATPVNGIWTDPDTNEPLFGPVPGAVFQENTE